MPLSPVAYGRVNSPVCETDSWVEAEAHAYVRML